MMAGQVFVARQEELGQLWQFLDEALDSQGHVCFVTGEAGSGKTALVTEFARRAQERHGDLVVAVGQCDAHTGIGDPYLPFREVLCQLTGDVEAKLARGAITQENASRLRQLTVLSCQVLVEVAPDLVGLFVPGAGIAGKLGKAVAEKAGWMDKLEALARAKPGDATAGPGRDESQVFEQYTKLLNTLAQKRPLLLILDDLHWADAGSTSLLFRLGRRIGGSRILILGTYRPEEVALERAGERHPLQKVLAEFKRYFGEVRVDLDRAGETGGQQFVQAILAVEPNRLGDGFRQVLFQRTRGHPLFTIELVRDMQERGALVQDEEGRWLEGPRLDWDELPDRVEGIIEERIGRLEQTLRGILSVASVEGQDFTAQIIARVEEMPEHDLLRVLSQELEKRHRLVREREEVQLGSQFLARYQFAHALFQQYLYSQLGAGERRLLHGQIAALLEGLYEGHTGRIAVQLARHYTEAGEAAKAVAYLRQAGDAAFRLYAYPEAALHYRKALEVLARLPGTAENRRLRVDILISLVAGSWIPDLPEVNLERLAEAERLVEGLVDPREMPRRDRVRLAHIYYWMGRVHFRGIAMNDAIQYYSQGLRVAEEAGHQQLAAQLTSAVGIALAIQGRNGRAGSLLADALAAQVDGSDRSERLQTLAYHGFVTALMGDYAAGVEELHGATVGARTLGHLRLACMSEILLALAHGCGCRMVQAEEAAHRAVEAAEEAGDPLLAYTSHGWMAWAQARAGQFEAAGISMGRAQTAAGAFGGRAQTAAGAFGGRPMFADWFLAARAEIAHGRGQSSEALDLAEQAAALAQEVDAPSAEAYARLVWGRALPSLHPPRWDEAEAQFAESVRLFELGESWLWAAQAQDAWGSLCRDRGDLAGARQHWEKAASQWETSGITSELERVRALIAALPEV